MKKFSLIDYIIIIVIICAIIFAFIHITTDDSSKLEKTAFDASTINKIPDTYSNYYKDGYIVKSSVEGFNASNGEEVSINGTVKWILDNGGSDVSIIIESDNQTYLTGLYKSVPHADIYINSISLENDGSKYSDLVEFTIKPESITSLNDLIKGIPKNTDYEISTTVNLDSIDPIKLQEISNRLAEHGKRQSVKVSNTDLENQIILVKSNNDNIKDADSILGNINGLTDYITLRVYDCSDSQLDSIEDNYEVTNVRNF